MSEKNTPKGGDSVRESRDRLIRDALVAGMTYEQAGATADVSERTVRRLMSDASFRSEVHSMRAERTSRLADRMSELGEDAVGVLAGLLSDENPSVRARAVQTSLAMGVRFRREVEMIDRIETLERRIESLLGSEDGFHVVS
jgi:osmotically-inducible protein OsmY